MAVRGSRALLNFALLMKRSGLKWVEDNVPRLGAALSYYALFSLSPLVLISLSIAGAIFGKEAVQGEFEIQTRGLLGEEAAKAIQNLLVSAHEHTSSASVIGVVVLIIGATSVFVELRGALNKIWGIKKANQSGILGFIKDRVLSLAMILVLGFLLLLSLVLSTVVAAVGKYFVALLPASETILQSLTFAASFGIVTLLFAAIFKVLPDAAVKWRDVWLGALMTSLLFTIGKLLIGLYLGKAGVTTVFGAAGSVVLILVWTYYSSLILFFGAEFTCLHAVERQKSKVISN